MKRIRKIVVSLKFDNNPIAVGELVQESKEIFFRYYPDFIKKGIEISPIKLKLNNNLNKAESTPFNGLFGLFADSLPDGWGRLLLDRTLISKGIDLSQVGELERLAFVGNQGMGALVYQPELENESQKQIIFELDEIASASLNLIEGTSTEILDDLYLLGGSSGGARPKILVGYNTKTNQLISSYNDLPSDFNQWLIKFPSHLDSNDIANIEFAYYKMALDANIEMSESKLFNGKSGKQYFGTKRFDRLNDNQRLHMQSAAGLMHDNFRLSSLDYGHLMDCAFRLERNVFAYEKILRIAAFNVFAHNRDDHSKNFSFLMDKQGNWTFAPCYDLTFSNSSHGMQSTMIAGESANPSEKHLLLLANYFQIKNAKNIIDEIKSVVNNWKKYAIESGVSEISARKISKIIQSKL
jgi:serine/threonine-protein kinase HipA